MTLNQVHALLVVILLFGAVLTALWGAEIAGALGGAWARGTAQAAAEKRRMVNAARETRESGAWDRVKAAGRGMRGAAKGAGAWARKENGPLRRVAAAAAAGAVIGAKGAARAAAGARRRRITRRAWTVGGDGTIRPPGSSGSGGGWRRSGRPSGSGTRTRPQRSRFRPARKLGVCDKCGVTAGAAGLQPMPVERPGGTQTQLWCYRCRLKLEREYGAPSAPAGPAIGGAPSPKPSLSPAREAIPLPAGNAPVPSVSAVSLPAGWDEGTAPGAQPAPQLPVSPQSTSGPVPVTAGTPAAIQSAPTGGAALMSAGAIGSGRPGSAVAVRPTGVLDSRPGTAVAVRGDVTDHREWVEHAKTVVQYVYGMFAYTKTMTEDMKAGECPDEAMTETAAWAETIYAYGTQILAELKQIDKDIEPWIRTVAAHGGPWNVASPRWLQGR